MSIESVTLVLKKIKSVIVSIDFPSICHEVMEPDDAIYSMNMSLSKLWELVMGREAWHPAVHGPAKSRTWLSIWTELNWLGDAIQPSHSHPLLLLLSIIPSIRVFSIESVICTRWPKYWSFRFSISPSNEYSGLIFFRIDCFALIAVHGTHTQSLL